MAIQDNNEIRNYPVVQKIGYCDSIFCDGKEFDAKQLEELENLECPICYEFLQTGSVSSLVPCDHKFCSPCINLIGKPKCPMCSEKITEICEIDSLVPKINPDNHLECRFNEPHLQGFLKCLNDDWVWLVKFMFQSLIDGERGMKHVRLETFLKGKKLIVKGPQHLIFETAERPSNLFIGYLRPGISMKLIMSQNDDTTVDVESDYADEVVGYLNQQLGTCFRALPYLLHRENKIFLYVRKFTNCTAYLQITISINPLAGRHLTPMKQQLADMRNHNFDQCHFKKLKKKFPAPCLHNCLRNMKDDYSDPCCKNPKH